MRIGARVSVVIPAYNAAGTIARAIGSALRQTIPDIEVLVVDDASTDNTAAVVEELAAADPRVRLLRQRVNGGPAAARNRALDEAGGTWIALLDADDRYEPSRMEHLLALAEVKGADIVCDNLLLISAANVFPSVPMIPEERMSLPSLVDLATYVSLNEGGIDRALRARPRFSYGFLKPVIRRDFLAGRMLRYDHRNRYAEDYMFAVRCLVAGAVWWVSPRPTYQYAVQDGTATHVQSADDLGRIVEFDRRLLADPAIGTDPNRRRAFERHLRSVERRFHYRRFVDAVKAGRFREAGKDFLESRTSAVDVLRILFWSTRAIAAKAVRGGYRAGPSATRKEQTP